MRPVPAAVLCLVLTPVVACGGSGEQDQGDAPADTVGTVALGPLCPQVHALVDALVVSTPSVQRAFSAQVHRLYDAADADARSSLTPLVEAADALVEAGVGEDFFAARDGIHRGVQAVDADCKVLGEPILHDGPH